MNKLIFFVLCSTFLLVAGQDPDEFVATNEWQTVREGQKVPPGLHIRLNLETGEREAKLLDPNEKSSTGVVATSSDSQEEISRANLEKAFANLDLSRDDVPTDSHAEEVRRKFRPYDELKKEFEELNLKVQTDQEILRELMDRLSRTTDHDERKTILTDLEYYLHQYDNGIFFADNNGLTLLLDFLNSTEIPAEIRQLTSLVLGAAFQGNPQVQLKGLHLGFVQSLVRLINGEHDEPTKLRLIYPLSTLLRNFPPAQKQFVDHGGAEAMTNILDWKHSNNRLAVRTIGLMNDLIVEKEQATDGRRAAYENLHLFEQLVERGWCSALVNRLEILDFEDFDSVEKVLHAFLPFRQRCRNEFEVIRPIFSRIEQLYSKDDPLYNDLFADLSLLQQTPMKTSSDEL